MGVILDSSCVILAERARETPVRLLRRVYEVAGAQEIALTAVGYTELVHGTHRGMTNAHRTLGRAYLEELVSALPVYDYTVRTAEIAGKIDAEQQRLGFKIPFADLLIGATALSLGFSVLTFNERHFKMIPGLEVMTF